MLKRKQIVSAFFITLFLLQVGSLCAQTRIDSFNVDGIKHVRSYQVNKSDSSAKEIISEKRFDASGKVIFDAYVEQYWVNGQVIKRLVTQIKILPGGIKEVLEIPLTGSPTLTRYNLQGRITERKQLKKNRAFALAEL